MSCPKETHKRVIFPAKMESCFYNPFWFFKKFQITFIYFYLNLFTPTHNEISSFVYTYINFFNRIIFVYYSC